MDIKSISPVAETEFTLLDRKDDAGEPVKVKLQVKYFGPEARRLKLDALKDLPYYEAILEYLVDAVIGWDLTRNGEPLACTEANRREVLYFLRAARVSDAKDPLERELGTNVMKFASDDRNYLKN